MIFVVLDFDPAPMWRLFEQQITELASSMDDTTLVKHDVRCAGEVSGVQRQVDVWIEGTVAGRQHVVVAECKRWKNKVGIADVDAFVGKLLDVGADRGVLYTTSGFTSPALERAKGARHPRVALVHIDDEEFDYRRALFDPCPAENCEWGEVTSWESEESEWGEFEHGTCNVCGTRVVRCGNCGEAFAFTWDEVECWCGAAYTIVMDRDRIETGVARTAPGID